MRKFTYLIALLMLSVSSWATVITWNQATCESIDVDAYNTTQTESGITITAAAPASGDYVLFGTPPAGTAQISLSNGGTLTFAPTSGQLTGIDITFTNMPYQIENVAGWDYDDSSSPLHLTWSGSAASSVVLATNGSNTDFNFNGITSVEFTVVPAAAPTSLTWNDANGLSEFYLVEYNMGGQYTGNTTETIDIVTATISATADGAYADFKNDGNEYGTQINLSDGGTLTFSTATGQFQSIVINTTDQWTYVADASTGWDSNTAYKLTWAGTATNTVVLGTASVHNITSIVFTFVPSTPAADETITWEQRQVNHVELMPYNIDDPQTSPVIKNIITTFTMTASGNCYFANDYLVLNNFGEVTFQSIVGDITGIVITCSNVTNMDDLPADWTYDGVAGTLTWDGTAAEQVTLSGYINVEVSSIVFTYTPASAPRLNQTFSDGRGQRYQITGAHTAKLMQQTIIGTLDIPEYVIDGGVTYYITEIAENAFKDNNELSNVSNGHNIAIIGAHAFDGCTWMTDFNLYSTVVDEIGDEAFKDCPLMQIYECYTSMPPVLGSNAFSGDGRINHIVVSAPMAYQYASGWSDYAYLITSWSGAPVIGEEIFWSNQMTTGLYEVTTVATYSNGYVGAVKTIPYSAEVNAIYPYSPSGTLVISEEVSYLHNQYTITAVGANSYKDNTDINVVLFPEGVTSIEAGAFLGCTGVENVFFLWDDPTAVTWADGNVGAEFATAASGTTKIFVPEGRLAAYQTWAPAWASCMMEGRIENITATEDPNNYSRFYRTFYDSSSDYMLPPSVWAHVGYVDGDEFILRAIAFDGQIIPAGTAVVLESETPTYRLIAVGNSAPAYTGRNDLVGTDVQITRASLGADADRVYVLGKEAWVNSVRQVGMGLYRYTGTYLGAHKAYLVLNSGGSHAPARFLFKHEEAATGVENVQGSDAQTTKVLRDGMLIIIKDGKEYNAQGQIVK